MPSCDIYIWFWEHFTPYNSIVIVDFEDIVFSRVWRMTNISQSVVIACWKKNEYMDCIQIVSYHFKKFWRNQVLTWFFQLHMQKLGSESPVENTSTPKQTFRKPSSLGIINFIFPIIVLFSLFKFQVLRANLCCYISL